MKTTKKEVKQAIREHIFERINSDEKQLNTKREKLEHFIMRFNGEKVNEYNLKRCGSEQELFKDYLWGIPFDFEYENYKIIEYLESIGLEQPENKTDSDSADLYMNLLYREMKQLCKEYDLQLITN